MVLALRGSRVDEIKLLTPKIISEGRYHSLMNALWVQPVTQHLLALAMVMSHIGVTLYHSAALGRAMRAVFDGLVPDAEHPVAIERAAGHTCSEIRSWACEIFTYNGQLLPHTTEVLTACESIMHRLHQAMQSPYAQQDISIQADLTPR